MISAFPTGACQAEARGRIEPACRVTARHSDERISPDIRNKNTRHEGMHLTLKQEATKPAAANVLQQQARFDTFLTATTTGDRTKRST